jgi:hypothetical protein
MAFKLSAATYVTGLEQQAANNLATLKYFATLTPPVTEALMRSDLETGQFQAFSNDGWDGFMAQMAAVSLDETAATAAEISIVNVIRAAVMPDPSLDCCGVVVPVIGNTSIGATRLVGSAIWEHAIEVKLAIDTDCNVKSIDLTLTGVPATLPTPTIKCLFEECTAAGRIFKYYWTSYAGDPTGVVYTTVVNCKDADDVSITSYAGSNVTFP